MAIIKTEPTTGTHFANRHAARTAIFDHIEGFYNRRRRHSVRIPVKGLELLELLGRESALAAYLGWRMVDPVPDSLRVHPELLADAANRSWLADPGDHADGSFSQFSRILVGGGHLVVLL